MWSRAKLKKGCVDRGLILKMVAAAPTSALLRILVLGACVVIRIETCRANADRSIATLVAEVTNSDVGIDASSLDDN